MNVERFITDNGRTKIKVVSFFNVRIIKKYVFTKDILIY